jgi:RimJ/RimL family protein N-acetyltransferase
MTTLDSPKGPITIREAVPADSAQLRTLRLEALRDHPAAYGTDYTSSEAQSVEAWEEHLTSIKTQNQGAFFIAVAGDQLIGMVCVSCGPSSKTRHSGTIWGVYVKEEWRGLRIAEAMIQASIEWARVQILLLVKLAVLTTNTAAIRCYSRSGFALYGIEPKSIFVDGVFYDEMMMSRMV